LVDPKNIDTLSSELENRLDDLFGENDAPLNDAQDKDLKEHYPLAELKNLILSIDWEITDEVLDKFLQQLKDLRLTYKHDKIVSTFLQILNSLGNYIKTNRAKAHPKTFKILNSVFSSLDKVVLSGDMSEKTKKKILRAEMNRYQELRTQIAKGKTVAGQPKKTVKPAVIEAPEVKEKQEQPVIVEAEPSGQTAVDAQEELILTDEHPNVAVAVETLAQAVEEIKRYIHEEINALKEEMQDLRMQK
jgi:hypothetical protein